MVVDGHHNEVFLEDVHLFSPPLDTLIPLLLCKFPGIGSNVMEFNDIFHNQRCTRLMQNYTATATVSGLDKIKFCSKSKSKWPQLLNL